MHLHVKKKIIECVLYVALVTLFGWGFGLFAFFFVGLLFKIEKSRLLLTGISMTVLEVFGAYRGFLILIAFSIILFIMMWGIKKVASFTAQVNE